MKWRKNIQFNISCQNLSRGSNYLKMRWIWFLIFHRIGKYFLISCVFCTFLLLFLDQCTNSRKTIKLYLNGFIRSFCVQYDKWLTTQKLSIQIVVTMGLGILIAKKRKKSWREMPKFLKNGHFIHGMAIINKFSWYNGRGSDVGSIWL